MRIAIVGSGIAGLACAQALIPDHQVTVYEAEPRLGGHTHTVDVQVDGITHPVDTGFLVCNERTYPQLLRLFAELDVPLALSEMSFSVSIARTVGGRDGHSGGHDKGLGGLEWGGSSLDTVFAQRRNLLSPRFWSLLRDLLRFNLQTTQLAMSDTAEGDLSLGEFLDREGYGRAFRDGYLLPMAGAIWSCPAQTMLDYPAATFLRFCHNHGLLQIRNRPQWYTVAGGARQYVEKIAARLADVRLGEPVLDIRRSVGDQHVILRSLSGTALYDRVVLACHSNQSLQLLADADAEEHALLAAVRYQPNRAVLHTDTTLLPRLRKVWSSWNYASEAGTESRVAVTYLLNRLQPLPFSSPVMVSLNPLREPDPRRVLAEFNYAHPIFDRAAIEAQPRLPRIQGRRAVWFAGAWTGNGFHEDGLKSGLAAARGIDALGRLGWRRAA